MTSRHTSNTQLVLKQPQWRTASFAASVKELEGHPRKLVKHPKQEKVPFKVNIAFPDVS